MFVSQLMSHVVAQMVMRTSYSMRTRNRMKGFFSRDRWRPETHTFHLPVGEMTLSLEDARVGTAVCWPGDGADRHPRDVAG
jgi:hypothetical protein